MRRMFLAALALFLFTVPAVGQGIYATIPTDGGTTSDQLQNIVFTFIEPSAVDPSTIELWVDGVAYTTGSPEVTWVPANLYFEPTLPFDEGSVVCSLATALDWTGAPLEGFPYVFDFFVDLTGPEVIYNGIYGIDSDTFPVILGPNTFAEVVLPGDTIVIEWHITDDMSDLDPLTIGVEVNGVLYEYPCPELDWVNDGVILSVDTIIVVDETTYVYTYADYIAFYLTGWAPMDTIWAELVTFDDAPDYGLPNILLDDPINGLYFYLDYLGAEAIKVSPLREGIGILRSSCTDQQFIFDLYDENGIDPTSLTVDFRSTAIGTASPMVATMPIWDYAATYWHVFVPDTFFRIVWPQTGFYWRSVCVIDEFTVDTVITAAADTFYDTLFYVHPLTDVDSWWTLTELIASNRDNAYESSAELSELLYGGVHDPYAHARLMVIWNVDNGLDFDPWFGLLTSEFYPYLTYDTVGCGYGDDDMTDDFMEVLFVEFMNPDVYYLYDTVLATYDEIAHVAKNIYCEYGWGYYNGVFEWEWQEPSILHPIMATTTNLAQVGTRVTITPNPPIYEGETLHVELLTCDDEYGNPLEPHSVEWDVTADRSSPYLVDYSPAHNTITTNTFLPISVTLADEYGVIDPTTVRMHIEYSGGVIDIDNPPAPFSVEFDWDPETGVFTWDPALAGVEWAEGDTVIVIFYDVADSIDLCEENHYAYEYALVTWTFFIINGPYLDYVVPANGTFTSCEDQLVTFNIVDVDGIDPATVEFLFEGTVFTTATVDTEIICEWIYFGTDSILDCVEHIYTPLQNFGGGLFVFDPLEGSYIDGRHINCAILNAEDIHGEPLWYVGDYEWSFTCDFTPPVYFEPQPAPGAYASGEHLEVSIALRDSISEMIGTSFVTLSVGDIIYSPETSPNCTWDGDHLNIDLGAAGVTFPDGIMVEACLDDLYDGVDYYCTLYPNMAEGLPYCWTFYIDNNPPLPTLLEPLDWTVTACATQKIEILLEDNLGIDLSSIIMIVEGVLYSIDSPELSFADDVLTFAPSIPWVDGDIVDFSLAQVGDLAGNMTYNSPSNTEFVVDLLEPLVLNTVPADAEILTEELLDITFDVYDESGITENTALVTVWVIVEEETTMYVYAWDSLATYFYFTDLGEGEYLIDFDLLATDIVLPSRGAEVIVEFAIQDAPDYYCFVGDEVGNEVIYEFGFEITPGWFVELELIDSTTVDSFFLVMGAAYGASDGLDLGIDELAIPLPPDTSGGALIPPTFLIDGDVRLIADFKSLADDEPMWMVWTGTSAGTLWWNPVDFPPYGAFVIDGWLDMRSTNFFAYGPAQAIFINFTPEFLTLRTGWNLVSVPVDPANPDPATVFGVPDYQIFWYNPWTEAYEIPTIIHPGYAYFVLYIPGVGDPDEITFSVPGTPVHSFTTEMPIGWNTIGSVFDFGGVSVDDIGHFFSVPADAIWGPGVYGYDPDFDAYIYSSEIYPGLGYWLYIDLPGPYTSAEITLESSWLRAAEYIDPLAAIDEAHLNIDGTELVLAIDANSTNDADPGLDRLMPPAMVDGQNIAYLNAGNMNLMRDARPVAEWTLVLTKSTTVATDRPITVNGQLIENSKTLPAGTYKVTFAGSRIPDVLMLHQNTPNPFNPITEIAFDLPENSEVTLEVFNMLGQKVRTLANGEFKAGRHNMVWNGKDISGRDAASGVYFYKLSTSDEILTKKMILLR